MLSRFPLWSCLELGLLDQSRGRPAGTWCNHRKRQCVDRNASVEGWRRQPPGYWSRVDKSDSTKISNEIVIHCLLSTHLLKGYNHTVFWVNILLMNFNWYFRSHYREMSKIKHWKWLLLITVHFIFWLTWTPSLLLVERRNGRFSDVDEANSVAEIRVVCRRRVSVRMVISWNISVGGGSCETKSELLEQVLVWPKQKQGRQSAGEVAAELKSSSMQISPCDFTTTIQSGTAKVDP